MAAHCLFLSGINSDLNLWIEVVLIIANARVKVGAFTVIGIVRKPIQRPIAALATHRCVFGFTSLAIDLLARKGSVAHVGVDSAAVHDKVSRVIIRTETGILFIV